MVNERESAMVRAATLRCWRSQVSPQPVGGGITNDNFRVVDGGRHYFVRIGADRAEHGILRFNELAVSRAAGAEGLSPPLVHHEPGALVFEWIEGRTLSPEDVREPRTLARVLALVARCHERLTRAVRGPVLAFWVFHVIGDYLARLRALGSPWLPQLARLEAAADQLLQRAGPIRPVITHNDLLAANFIDSGDRLWLLDWEYAGFNGALFDLAGLASNNQLEVVQERQVLETYFGRPPEPGLLRRFHAMKCASLMREALWSMVQEQMSGIDFDFHAYSAENLERFDRAWCEEGY